MLALLLFSIPAGEKCPKCNKYFTSHYTALAKKLDSDKTVELQFHHCHYCHNKFGITENGLPIDENGNYIDEKEEE